MTTPPAMVRAVVVLDTGFLGPYVLDEVLTFPNMERARGMAEGREAAHEAITVFVEGDPDHRLEEWRESESPARRAFVPVIEAALR